MKKAASTILIVFLAAAVLLPNRSGAGMFVSPEAPRAPVQPITNSLRTASAAASCSYSAEIDDLQKQINYDSYVDWIEKLSGLEPVSIGGTQYTIETRNSYAMFATNNNRAKAFEYIHSLLVDWGYPAEQIEEDPFIYDGNHWKNLVLTIPGTEEQYKLSVLLTAHLDDAPPYAGPPSAEEKAPGADDNATGSAALLEAARVLKDHPLKHTVRIIWFTGEEQYLRGSAAYANDHNVSGVIGVINLDMFGYDGDGDNCFDIHVGSRAASDIVGRCVQESVSAYSDNLSTGYINNYSATSSSDHSSFWSHNVGAVEIGENFAFFYELVDSCPGDDETKYYHTPDDTLEHMYPQYAFDITRAALAAFFSLGSMDEYKSYLPGLR